MKSLNPLMIIAFALTGASAGYLFYSEKKPKEKKINKAPTAAIVGGLIGLMAAQLQVKLLEK